MYKELETRYEYTLSVIWKYANVFIRGTVRLGPVLPVQGLVFSLYRLRESKIMHHMSQTEQRALQFLHIYCSDVRSHSSSPESNKQNLRGRTLDLPSFFRYKHIPFLKNLPLPAPNESLPYWFQGNFAASFVLKFCLGEFLLSTFANRFELRCEPKRLILLYFKICPCFAVLHWLIAELAGKYFIKISKLPYLWVGGNLAILQLALLLITYLYHTITKTSEAVSSKPFS